MNGFLEMESADPSQFELALRPWELLARPKSGDAFRHRIAMLCGPDFIIYREAFSSALSAIGLSPSGMLAIAVTLSQDNSVEYWGQSHGRASCPLTLPGPLHVTWNHMHEQIVALIGLESLRKSLPEREFEHLERLAQRRRADLTPETLQALCLFLNDTLKVCERWPIVADEPRFLIETHHQLLRFMSLIVRNSMGEEAVPRESVRRRGFQRALEFLRENKPIQPSMAELCEAAGTSERTLQYAFHDAFNMSPREFLIRRRLHAVRRELLMSDHNAKSVGSIAIKHGFYELGRFAGTYRSYFGEKPSETAAVTI